MANRSMVRGRAGGRAAVDLIAYGHELGVGPWPRQTNAVAMVIAEARQGDADGGDTVHGLSP